MKALEFACFFHKILDTMCIYLESEIIGFIYNEYKNNFYEKYSLFELIHMLNNMSIVIDCDMNKKSILKMIEDKDIELPPLDRYEETHNITYDCYEVLYHKCSFRFVIYIKNTDIKIMKRDRIKIQDNIFEVESISRTGVALCDTNIYRHHIYNIHEFISLFYNNNITILSKN